MSDSFVSICLPESARRSQSSRALFSSSPQLKSYQLEDVKRYFTCRAPTIQNLAFAETMTQEKNLIHVPVDNSQIVIEIEARNEHRVTMIRQLETRLGKLRKDEKLSEKHGTHEEVRNGNRFNVTLTIIPYFHSTATEDCCGSEDAM